MKKTATAITALALIGALAVGCTPKIGEPLSRQATKPQAQEAVPAELPEDDLEEQAPAEPASPVGSRDNPFAYGDTATASDNDEPTWEITVGEPTDATKAIADENRYNEPPATGNSYYAIPVTLTYLGAESATPWMEFDVSFVDSSGVTRDQEFVVSPWPDLMDASELYTGGTTDVHVIVQSPSIDGHVRVTYGYDVHAFFG